MVDGNECLWRGVRGVDKERDWAVGEKSETAQTLTG